MANEQFPNPFSRRRRTMYLLMLGLVFVAVLPVVLLYASGYRWKEGSGLVRTGGVFISVPYSNATVFLNDKPIGVAGFLKHDFYVDDLIPDAYSIRVDREGDQSWKRIVVVEEQLVTDTRTLLIAQDPTVVQLVIGTTTEATSTRSIALAEHTRLLALFKKPVATTTTGALAEVRGEELFVEAGDVVVRWTDKEAFAPSNFCGRPSFCSRKISIENSVQETSVNAAFFNGGIVYATKEGGVFFAEADIRPEQVREALFGGAGADFRIDNGRLIVQSGKEFFEVETL